MIVAAKVQICAENGALRRVNGRLLAALGTAAIVFVAGAWLLVSGTAQAQSAGNGYMRVMTAHGQMAGESTDAAHMGWIPLQQATVPSAADIAAMAQESRADSAAAGAKPGTIVHKPVTIIKDRDDSSLALLSAWTGHQKLPEVDIVLTKVGDQPTVTYKLTDATIIAIRAGGDDNGTEGALEQVRFNYAKIEIEK